MAKKKVSKQSKEAEQSSVVLNEVLVDDSTTHIGTPTMVLLPARNYKFKVIHQEIKITIPRKGTYHDLDKEFYSLEEGEFDIYDEVSKVLYIPSVTKVLLGLKKYPYLESNQLFAPIALVFNDEEVDVIGQVIEMMSPEGSE
jgi:hypothetical protein